MVEHHQPLWTWTNKSHPIPPKRHHQIYTTHGERTTNNTDNKSTSTVRTNFQSAASLSSIIQSDSHQLQFTEPKWINLSLNFFFPVFTSRHANDISFQFAGIRYFFFYLSFCLNSWGKRKLSWIFV
jgi:hypothetical protein